MLQHVVETETCRTQCGGDVVIEGSNEGQLDRRLGATRSRNSTRAAQWQ
jgi:hypothetical protein